jgi:cell division protein FtsQ
MAPETMAKHHYSFPVLTGIDAGDSADSRKERMEVYMRMMAELDADGKHNSEQISEIDLTDPEDARVLMPEQGADILAHLGEDHFLDRYERYQAHIAEWRQQYPNLAAVDLRYEDQVVLEMASGKETAETSNGGAGTPTNLPSTASGGASPMTGPAPKNSAAKSSPAGSSAGKSLAAKKSKPTSNKKHAAPQKRTTAANTLKRTTLESIQRRASTTRPAATTSGSNSRSPKPSPAVVAQGG